MSHKLYKVVHFELVADYTLTIKFDDESTQTINFLPILQGALFGPLRDSALFNQVEIDPEVHTLVWPNGADLDPETLRNWPEYAEHMKQMADRWAKLTTETA
ncbi:MAG: DUF2442 domain-containing protein [Candidatus Promineifilaceae bacterium]